MDNNQNRFTSNPWNRFQNPLSSTSHANSSGNLPYDGINIWRLPQNGSISNNLRSTNDNNFRQNYFEPINFSETVRPNVCNSLQHAPNIRLPQPENFNSNFSSFQSVPNGSHNSANFNVSSETLPSNFVHNLSTSISSATNSPSAQGPISYQNSTSSQSATVTNPHTLQPFSDIRNFKSLISVPPPPINNLSSVPTTFNLNTRPPLPPFCIPPPQINNTSSNDELSSHRQIVPPNLFTNPPLPQPFAPVFPKMEESSNIVQSQSPMCQKEEKLSKFLQKCLVRWSERTGQRNTSVTMYREMLKDALRTMKNLLITRENLVKLLKTDHEMWHSEMRNVLVFQHRLDNLISSLTEPRNLEFVQRKLKVVKKKRSRQKRRKQSLYNLKLKKLKEREELHQEIDKWLDSIKEKNLKLKREAEMKKEADSILSEVRRKIHEAKRTIEKIKLFEKLRNTRQAKAITKGLFYPEHDEKFQNSISTLRETMLRQLSDYEAEEKALKVMLEAEQEGQLEEEALWRIKKLRSLQQKRQSNIIESLFGDTVEEPAKEDPLFLFYQFHNSGNKSVESLSQIRQQWDMYIDENGDPIPQQWVVPVPPSSPAWEVVLKT